MTSQNGSQELKEIVNEVKESEEWEGIKMSILDIGIQEGERRGIKAAIEMCKELGTDRKKLQKIYVRSFSLQKKMLKDM